MPISPGDSGDRLVQLALGPERIAEIVVRLGEAGIGREISPVEPLGFVQASGLMVSKSISKHLLYAR